jgi:uncharacterized protein (DUF1499 family)
MLPLERIGGSSVPSPSRVASSAAWIGLVAAAAFGIGPALSVTGLVAGFVGFRIYTFGLLLGLISLLVGLAGLWHTRASAGRPGRARALTGVGIGLILAAGVGISLGSAGRLPAINDITTNPADPPQFSHAGQLEPNRERDLAYPGTEFAAQQQAAYPDLEPIRLNAARNAVFEDSLAAAADLGWEITYQDADQGLIEATDTTAIFRFVDDVTIRIRSSGKITVVDVRSKSRDGQGDLGANAERIRAFRESLTE